MNDKELFLAILLAILAGGKYFGTRDIMTATHDIYDATKKEMEKL